MSDYEDGLAAAYSAGRLAGAAHGFNVGLREATLDLRVARLVATRRDAIFWGSVNGGVALCCLAAGQLFPAVMFTVVLAVTAAVGGRAHRDLRAAICERRTWDRNAELVRTS